MVLNVMCYFFLRHCVLMYSLLSTAAWGCFFSLLLFIANYLSFLVSYWKNSVFH